MTSAVVPSGSICFAQSIQVKAVVPMVAARTTPSTEIAYPNAICSSNVMTKTVRIFVKVNIASVSCIYRAPAACGEPGRENFNRTRESALGRASNRFGFRHARIVVGFARFFLILDFALEHVGESKN